MKIYLYVKKHLITGIQYFGKTTKDNPYAYMGSGKYWLRHIKKHGVEHVITTDVWEFDIPEESITIWRIYQRVCLANIS